MAIHHSSLQRTKSGAVQGMYRNWSFHYEPGYDVCTGSVRAGKRIYASFSKEANGSMRVHNPKRHKIPQYVLDVARSLLLGESTYLLR